MRGTSAKTRFSAQASRSIHKVMQEVNTELSRVHKTIKQYINHEQYIHATNFAEQYISYTSLWNLKFSYNMESPEVALLQLLHFDYIFKHELPTAFTKEREVFSKMHQLFANIHHIQMNRLKSASKKCLITLTINDNKRMSVAYCSLDILSLLHRQSRNS